MDATMFIPRKRRTRQHVIADQSVHHVEGFLIDEGHTLWTIERPPVVLILFDASKKRAFWVEFQRYFSEDETRRPSAMATSIRVHIPKRQRWNRIAVLSICEGKRASYRSRRGERS